MRDELYIDVEKPKKRIVYYDQDLLLHVALGQPAILKPFNHTSPLVSNKKYIETSTVISYQEDTGRIETVNTVYLPTLKGGVATDR